MNINITIPAKKEEFYEYLVRLMNSIAVEKLTKKEMEVLVAYMIKYDNLAEKGEIVSTDVRKEIRKQVGTNEMNFNNILSRLRKKGHFVNGRFKWYLKYDDVDSIIFKFEKR